MSRGERVGTHVEEIFTAQAQVFCWCLGRKSTFFFIVLKKKNLFKKITFISFSHRITLKKKSKSKPQKVTPFTKKKTRKIKRGAKKEDCTYI